MQIQNLQSKARAVGIGLAILLASGWANADPPTRVARLGYTTGSVSFSPAGDPDWLQAVVNRPLTTGDRLWTAANSRAELQIGGAAIRLGPATSATLLNLNDRMTQVRLSQGSLKIRVRRMGPNQTFEVNTPNLAFTFRSPGEYRIDVDVRDDATAVTVLSGQGEVYGEGASYAVTPRNAYRFYGTGLSDYEPLLAQREDALDRWARERDRRLDNSKSARYLSSNVVGYEDLDANGIWRLDPKYGNVWIPNRVAADWTPYRNGHWTWVDPWGWTWVDDAPWGYAVSHYGRWARLGSSWGWVPGPAREQAVYAPALVAFVGGKNFQVSASVGGTAAPAVGWFPLAPREVYQPAYQVSRAYFDNINRSNAVIAPSTITNVYNNTPVVNNTTVVNNNSNVVNVVYANQTVTGALVAVPAQAFVQSQPVAKAAVVVSAQAAVSAPVAHVAAVAPIPQSVHGGAAIASATPPAREREVFARTAPPAPPVSFVAQQTQLAVKPGTPIDDMRRAQLKTATPSEPAAKVSVVASVQAPAPTAAPPATAPKGRSPEERRADAPRDDAARADSVKSEAAKGEAAKAVTAKADALKVEAAKSDAAKAEAIKAETAKAASLKADLAKAEALKADAAKADATKASNAKVEANVKAEAARADSVKAEGARADAAKAEATKAAALKGEAARADVVKVDTAKTAAAAADTAKAESVKAEAAKAASVKADAAKADAAKAEAARADAAKAEATKAATARAEAGKAEAARNEAAKAEAVKAEAARAASVKADTAKAEAAKAEAVRVEAAKAAAAKAEEAKAALAKTSGATPLPREARGPAPKSEPDAKVDEEKKKKRADDEAQKR